MCLLIRIVSQISDVARGPLASIFIQSVLHLLEFHSQIYGWLFLSSLLDDCFDLSDLYVVLTDLYETFLN